MKINCIIDSLGCGGAEKVMTFLASGLAGKGHNVTIVTLNAGIPDIFCVPPGVKRLKAFGYPGVCRWFNIPGQIKRVLVLREYIRPQKPDLIISFIDITNIIVLFAFGLSGIPVFVAERTNPMMHRIGFQWRILRRLLYPKASRVVMLTEDTLEWANQQRPGWKTAMIPNPIIRPKYSLKVERPAFFGKGHNVVAMGQLNYYKGFDILIKVFAGLAEKYPDWRLSIIGEGRERRELELLAEKTGVVGKVAFPGFCRNPYDVFKYADLFVLSSRFEGFPNVLAEAMSCGVACASFDCHSGPGTIIRDGIDGVLVSDGDSAALSAAMGTLMSDEGLRRRLGLKASEVVERFSLEKYIDSWNKLLAGS